MSRSIVKMASQAVITRKKQKANDRVVIQIAKQRCEILLGAVLNF
jgi:hypothetical protein